MAQPTSVDLGAFAAGEVPPPLEITFTDFDGAAVDLTSFGNVQMNIKEELDGNSSPLGNGGITVSDAPGGKVTYTWVKADMADAGEYTAQAWVDDGTNFFASDLYTYSVYDGPGDPP